MTITIRGPGDVHLRFPDGTDQSTIDQAVQNAFGKAGSSEGTKSTLGQISTVADIGYTVPSALGQGAIAIAGAGGDISELALRGYDWLRGAEQMTPDQMEQRTLLPTTRQLTRGYEDVTGTQFYEPKGTAAKLVGAGLKAAPSAATMSGGLRTAAAAGVGALTRTAGTNAVKYGVLPAAAGEAAGQITEGGAMEPYARLAGTAAGLAAPSIAGRMVTPLPMPASRQAAVRNLEQQGVRDLTAGQRTGSRKLQYAESELGGPRIDNMMEGQQEQFTTSILSRARIPGTRATPETMQRAYTDMGSEFDRLAAANTARADPQFTQDIVQAANGFAALGPSQERINAFRRFTNDIGMVMSPNGDIAGPAYQALRSRIERAARSSSDPEFASALRDIRNALDDSMERSMVAAGSPDVGAWRDVRQRYKDFLVVEHAAKSAGAEQGLISPAMLRNAETAVGGTRNYVLGRGNFGDLARDGQTVMKPLPQSGTAPRQAVRGIGTTLGAIAGGSLGSGDIYSMMAGGMAGTMVPDLLGRLLLSRLGRSYLGNQLVNTPRISGQGAAVAGLGAARSITGDKSGGPMIDSRGQYVILP